MALQIHKGKQNRARRILVYGENGIGKSSWAAKFPDPIFFNIEDGIGDLDVHYTDLIKRSTQFVEFMVELYHDTTYKTVVIDTVDWLEQIVHNEVAGKLGKETMEDIGFGKGYQRVELAWKGIFEGLTALWKQDRHIIFVAHAQVKKFKDPLGDAYDYWSPALEEKGSGLITEWCDEVLFARSVTATKAIDEGFGAKRRIGIDLGERIMVCQESSSQVAKNRLNMPVQIPLSYEAFSAYLPKAKVESGNIEGVVINGSSKTKVSA